MAKNFVSCGDTIVITAAGAIASGAAVLWGALLVVALADIPDTERGAASKVDIWDLPKDTSTAFAEGEVLAWSAADGQFIAAIDAVSGDCIGCAVASEAAGASDATVRALLLPGGGSVVPSADAAAITALQATVADHESRIAALE